MESSNHTAAVISLGKKIVRELKLQTTTNTLVRWMAHYIAELIERAENETSPVKLSKVKKECCDTILKVWANRKDLPESLQPLTGVREAVEVLSSIKRKNPSADPWRNFSYDQSGPWGKFTKKTVHNFDYSIALAIFANLTKEKLEKEKEWLEHEGLLSDAERQLLRELDFLLEEESHYGGVKIVYVSPGEEKKRAFRSHDEVAEQIRTTGEKTTYRCRRIESECGEDRGEKWEGEEKKIKFAALPE